MIGRSRQMTRPDWLERLLLAWLPRGRRRTPLSWQLSSLMRLLRWSLIVVWRYPIVSQCLLSDHVCDDDHKRGSLSYIQQPSRIKGSRETASSFGRTGNHQSIALLPATMTKWSWTVGGTREDRRREEKARNPLCCPTARRVNRWQTADSK